MKSILVDALRQSKGKDSSSTLSDSGSFDTTQTEFGPTANDENLVDSGLSAEDLELLQTGVFQKSNAFDQTGVFENEEIETPGDDNLPMRSAANSPTMLRRTVQATPKGTSAPAMARLAPLLCITLAISAAAALAGYRYFAGIDTGDSIGASTLYPSDAGDSREVGNTVQSNGAGRFPFIDIAAEVDAGDLSE